MVACALAAQAQTVISGQVTDSETGEAIPFVNVYLMGTTQGTTSDFDGFYNLVCTVKADSIRYSYLGYETKIIPFPQGPGPHTINIKLNSEGVSLAPLVIVPGENPAHRIIRAAQERRKANNPYSLASWECESFNKIQIAIDNVSDKLKDKKVMKSVAPLFDTISYLTGDNGKQVLPMFISETISDFYVVNNPRKVKEYIRATKIKGVGIEDGSLTSQLLGSTFQQYNFFENWSLILDKDFISPIAAGAFGFYKYYLRDSMEMDGYWTYKIEIRPKRPQDLAFTGFIWITDSSFALKQVALEINAQANLNFIEKLRIQQENIETETGQWVPKKTRVTIDISELTDNTAGLVAQFYNSNRNYVVNKPHPPKFYDDPLVVADTAQDHNDKYWEDNRHDKIGEEEKRVYAIVDSVRNNPIVKTYVEIVDIAVNGYFELGKIEVGPYALAYGYNSLEGNRFRLGFKTNYKFSKKLEIYTYGAYGTLDERFKYSTQVEYTLSKRTWTKIGVKHRDDVDQIGITDSDIQASNLFTSVSVFQANQLNRTLENKLWVKTDLTETWQTQITLHNKRFEFEPIKDFNFSYYPIEGDTLTKSSRFTNTTISAKLRFSYHELFLINDHDRISLGALRGPNVTLEYKRGLKGVLEGNFNYDELNISIAQKAKIGVFGNSYYTVRFGQIWGTLPYPILSVHRGNESFISSTTAFNLMNFFEFASDRYVSVFYEHHFEGLLMNRVPILRKGKLRSFAGFRGVLGDMSEANRNLLPNLDEQNRNVSDFETLNKLPYMELNYGIENIFKLGRIEAIHRLSHLQKPGVSPFGIKVSLQLEF